MSRRHFEYVERLPKLFVSPFKDGEFISPSTCPPLRPQGVCFVRRYNGRIVKSALGPRVKLMWK